MNRHPGKNVSYCLFKSCSHQRFSSILHSFPLRTVPYTSCAVISGHKLDTSFWGVNPRWRDVKEAVQHEPGIALISSFAVESELKAEALIAVKVQKVETLRHMQSIYLFC